MMPTRADKAEKRILERGSEYIMIAIFIVEHSKNK